MGLGGWLVGRGREVGDVGWLAVEWCWWEGERGDDASQPPRLLKGRGARAAVGGRRAKRPTRLEFQASCRLKRAPIEVHAASNSDRPRARARLPLARRRFKTRAG